MTKSLGALRVLLVIPILLTLVGYVLCFETSANKSVISLYMRYGRARSVYKLLYPGRGSVLIYGGVYSNLSESSDRINDEYFTRQTPVYEAHVGLLGKIRLYDSLTRQQLSFMSKSASWLQNQITISSLMRPMNHLILPKRSLDSSLEASVTHKGAQLLSNGGHRKFPMSEHWHLFQRYRMAPSRSVFVPLQLTKKRLSTLNEDSQRLSGSESATEPKSVPIPFATLKPKASLAEPGYWWEVLALNRTWSGEVHYYGLDRASLVQCAQPLQSDTCKAKNCFNRANSMQSLAKSASCNVETNGNITCIIPRLDRDLADLDQSQDPDELPLPASGNRTGGGASSPFSPYPNAARDHFNEECELYSVVDKISRKVVATIKFNNSWIPSTRQHLWLSAFGIEITITKKLYWPEWLYVDVVLGIQPFQKRFFRG